MLEYMIDFFISWFYYPHIVWTYLLIGIGLAIIFGAIWFVPYWTPILRKPWAWAILAGSAILSLVAVTLIQIPLQFLAGQVLGHFWSQEVLMNWLLLAGIPQILLSGLVQEGSKLTPVVIYWWRKGKSIEPKLGLVIGAIAGLGFGVFFTVAFHIAVSALAGYGLAKGWGWQFYLLASFLHGLLNYSVVFLQSEIFTVVHLEIYAAVYAIIVTSGVLWLRWKKTGELAESPALPPTPSSST